jgi:hypothetical protein
MVLPTEHLPLKSGHLISLMDLEFLKLVTRFCLDCEPNLNSNDGIVGMEVFLFIAHWKLSGIEVLFTLWLTVRAVQSCQGD